MKEARPKRKGQPWWWIRCVLNVSVRPRESGLIFASSRISLRLRWSPPRNFSYSQMMLPITRRLHREPSRQTASKQSSLSPVLCLDIIKPRLIMPFKGIWGVYWNSLVEMRAEGRGSTMTWPTSKTVSTRLMTLPENWPNDRLLLDLRLLLPQGSLLYLFRRIEKTKETKPRH